METDQGKLHLCFFNQNKLSHCIIYEEFEFKASIAQLDFRLNTQFNSRD